MNRSGCPGALSARVRFTAAVLQAAPSEVPSRDLLKIHAAHEGSYRSRETWVWNSLTETELLVRFAE